MLRKHISTLENRSGWLNFAPCNARVLADLRLCLRSVMNMVWLEMVQGIWFRVCVAEKGGGVNFLSGGGDILFNFSFCPKLNKFHFVQKGFMGLLYLFVLLNQMREGRG